LAGPAIELFAVTIHISDWHFLICPVDLPPVNKYHRYFGVLDFPRLIRRSGSKIHIKKWRTFVRHFLLLSKPKIV